MNSKEVKLSKLGQQVEEFVIKLMKDVQKPQDKDTPPEERVSLTDKMKVLDRALKWEAIKQKADDDEGGFFSFKDDEEGEDSQPSKRVKKGQSSGTGFFSEGH